MLNTLSIFLPFLHSMKLNLLAAELLNQNLNHLQKSTSTLFFPSKQIVKHWSLTLKYMMYICRLKIQLSRHATRNKNWLQNSILR
jgi:hypothetical protein